ncbi:TetR/AcrR family transcriptional regulator [Caenibius sp. WL]|uniref:TetR/AcrR family transcriptional regulator n=1 Tax=Caenibius sp. WL TaxID=2872646 RepID=UPI001C99A3AD|nr:TetR/AcrR family transcriptional regulator [Caenibius sp. WL]QZP08708.1 TetR/AcrR family transcriptional regulator [Caenibius sp. WL]
MARPQAADYDDRREAILRKAAQMYASAGFLGTSIADLAAACDTSKALIYHYFSSKDEILYEIMDSHISALLHIVDNIESRSNDRPEQQLEELTRRFVELYVDASAYHKVLASDLDKLSIERRSLIITGERTLIATVETMVRTLSPVLDAKPGQVRAATMLYFGMINWMHTWFRADGPLDSQDVVNLVMQIFLQGLPK